MPPHHPRRTRPHSHEKSPPFPGGLLLWCVSEREERVRSSAVLKNQNLKVVCTRAPKVPRVSPPLMPGLLSAVELLVVPVI